MPDEPRRPRASRPRRAAGAARRNGSTTPAGVLWQGGARNRLLWLLSLAGLAVLALGITLAVEPVSDVLATVAAAAGCVAAGLLIFAGTLAYSRVRVRVRGDCVEIHYGHFGLPRRRIPLVQVLECSTERISPRGWGGWGAHWMPERGTAVVVRRGPGLVLRLGGGTTFRVTVDDADGAARAIRSARAAATAG